MTHFVFKCVMQDTYHPLVPLHVKQILCGQHFLHSYKTKFFNDLRRNNTTHFGPALLTPDGGTINAYLAMHHNDEGAPYFLSPNLTEKPPLFLRHRVLSFRWRFFIKLSLYSGSC